MHINRNTLDKIDEVLPQERMRVFVVTGEHPHHLYLPLEIFQSEESARARCVELTTEFLTAWWEVHRDDEPLPEVTTNNWYVLAEEYGEDEEEIQVGGFGRWFVDLFEKEVQP